MHYAKVTVNRDETASMTVHVGAWEIPVLEAKHGHEDGKVVVGELVDFPKRPWPENAASEMQRLNKLYGVTGSGDNAPTFAEQVYGMGSQGVKALGKAIAEAKAEAEPKRKQARAEKVALA